MRTTAKNIGWMLFRFALPVMGCCTAIVSVFAAIAGAAVPVVLVYLDSERLRFSYSYSAHGDIVEDSVERCAERLRAGEQVYFHRYGDKVAQLQALFPEPQDIELDEALRKVLEIMPPCRHKLVHKLVKAAQNARNTH